MDDNPLTIGLDLGGTHLKAGLVARDGSLLQFEKLGARASESLEATLAALLEGARRMEAAARARGAETRIAGLALGCPGAVDPESGVQLGSTPNLPHWVDVPVRDWLATRLPWPVAVDNDANLAALAEARCGAGRGARAVVMITLGTGVGGGLVLGGRVWRGVHGGAGEIGHVVISPGGAPCACGKLGCVEAYASAGGMVRRVESAIAKGVASTLAANGPPSAERIFAAAADGDALAGSIVQGAVRALAMGLGVLVHVVDPDVIVIGGGVAQAGEGLFSPLREALQVQVLDSHRGRCRVVRAELGERAGTIGAGLYAWHGVG